MKKQKLRDPSEKEIQQAILTLLAYKKIFHYRNNSGAFKTQTGHFYRFGTKGSPDIICVVGGRYVGIEVKNARGRQNEAQVAFQEALEQAGGKYILARSPEDIIKQLNL